MVVSLQKNSSAGGSMRVFQINIFGNLSTGRIAVDLYRTLRDSGHDGIVAFARNSIAEDIPYIRIGNKWSVYLDVIATRFTDRAGFYSSKSTKRLIEQIKNYNPDIIHLHNIHGYYINIEILFNYLKETKIPVVWTLHDCWSFTGHCCNFEFIKCEKWKNGCYNCKQKRSYPASYFLSNCTSNYSQKKALFTSVENMTLVTPSYWLKELVEHSFMQHFPITVIRNGVDLNVFKPTYGNWLKNHGIDGKKIILGVAGTWTPMKGLSDLIELADKLPDKYQMIVVGVSKKQKSQLPASIIGIERTYDSKELAELYTSAYVFVNPTYEDNFPNVNIEALACGTPIITYKTGGCPEIITDEIGSVVSKGDVNGLLNMIISCKFNKEVCEKKGKSFDRNICYKQYIDLYEKIIRLKRVPLK